MKEQLFADQLQGLLLQKMSSGGTLSSSLQGLDNELRDVLCKEEGRLPRAQKTEWELKVSELERKHDIDLQWLLRKVHPCDGAIKTTVLGESKWNESVITLEQASFLDATRRMCTADQPPKWHEGLHYVCLQYPCFRSSYWAVLNTMLELFSFKGDGKTRGPRNVTVVLDEPVEAQLLIFSGMSRDDKKKCQHSIRRLLETTGVPGFSLRQKSQHSSGT